MQINSRNSLYSKKLGGTVPRDWGIVVFYTLLIYVSLPVAPGVWKRFVALVGSRSRADYLVLFSLGLCALLIIFYLIAQRKQVRNFVWLAVLFSVYVIGISKIKFPVERIHFMEYSLLSILLFRALSHHLQQWSLYLWSGIITFSLGWVDEGIQYLLPNRVYDTRDVIINGLAGVLGLLLVALCFQPRTGKLRDG